MPELKLIYFNARGRAELARWIFAYGGIDYTDERINKEDWPERKKTIFLGKLPVLMVDGQPLPQSMAIARYAAKLAGLIPDDEFQSARCDSVCQTLSDVTGEGYKIMMSNMSEEEKKKEYKENFFPNVMKPPLEQLEKKLSTQEWFAGAKMSWGDFTIALVFGEVLKRKPELLDSYPHVVALVKKVRAIPSIKQWIETSPDTEF